MKTHCAACRFVSKMIKFKLDVLNFCYSKDGLNEINKGGTKTYFQNKLMQIIA